MNAKHQFKYIYSDTDLEEYSPLEVTFEVPGSATITQMLRNFEQYLRACGYVFDGTFDIVPEGYDILDEYDGTLYEFDENKNYTIHPADSDGWCNDNCECTTEVKGWNEGLAKLEKDIKEERAIRGKASLRADELKEMNEKWNKLSNDEKANCLDKANKMSGL